MIFPVRGATTDTSDVTTSTSDVTFMWSILHIGTYKELSEIIYRRFKFEYVQKKVLRIFVFTLKNYTKIK